MKPELICYGHHAGDPYFNMAFDEWMLGEALIHPDRMLIRLYTWGVGCITFGCNQKRETAVNMEQLGDTPVIRRITGGRALFHDPSELTYSIAVHDDCIDPSVRSSVAASSAVLAAVLVDFLGRVGIRSDYARQSARDNSRPEFFHKAPCFASHARHEVISDRGKMIASAQRRIDRVMLQHGAIKINGLAAHPALPMTSDNQLPANKLVFVDEAQFLRHRSVFEAVFGDRLGYRVRSEAATEAELCEVQKRAVRIKENPFARRDIFKQSNAVVSLLDA